MAGTFGNPEVVQEEVDILIIGGWMLQRKLVTTSK